MKRLAKAERGLQKMGKGTMWGTVTLRTGLKNTKISIPAGATGRLKGVLQVLETWLDYVGSVSDA